MSEWTEGVCSDGAAILRDGVMVPITELLSTLNGMEAEILRLRSLVEWRKISDVEPPHETLVKLYSPPSFGRPDGTQEVGFASTGKRTLDPITGGTWSNMCWHGSATHWLPLLPPPPKETP